MFCAECGANVIVTLNMKTTERGDISNLSRYKTVAHLFLSPIKGLYAEVKFRCPECKKILGVSTEYDPDRKQVILSKSLANNLVDVANQARHPYWNFLTQGGEETLGYGEAWLPGLVDDNEELLNEMEKNATEYDSRKQNTSNIERPILLRASARRHFQKDSGNKNRTS
jgi:hypothetical protein